MIRKFESFTNGDDGYQWMSTTELYAMDKFRINKIIPIESDLSTIKSFFGSHVNDFSINSSFSRLQGSDKSKIYFSISKYEDEWYKVSIVIGVYNKQDMVIGVHDSEHFACDQLVGVENCIHDFLSGKIFTHR